MRYRESNPRNDNYGVKEEEIKKTYKKVDNKSVILKDKAINNLLKVFNTSFFYF